MFFYIDFRMENVFEFLDVHQEKIFWGTFILIGIFTVAGAFSAVSFVEIPIGLVLIILGLNRLLDEVNTKKSRKDRDYLNANFRNIRQLGESAQKSVAKLKKRHDLRFHNMNQRRILMEKRIEQNYRDLAGKIMEIENELSDIKRAIKALA